MTTPLSIILTGIVFLVICLVAWKIKPIIDKYKAEKAQEAAEADEYINIGNVSHQISIEEKEPHREEETLEALKEAIDFEADKPYVDANYSDDDTDLQDGGTELVRGVSEEDAEAIQAELMKDVQASHKKRHPRKNARSESNPTQEKPKAKRGRPKKKNTEQVSNE